MKKYIFTIALVCIVMALTACDTSASIGVISGTDEKNSSSISSSQESSSSVPEVSSSSEPEFEANPSAAIEEIYLNIDMMGLVDAQDEDVTDRFLIPMDIVDEYSIKYSLGRFGVADTYIVKPADGQMEEVERKLADIKDTRIREFEKYDVMNSYSISQNAEIYIRGEYVIMVMLEDNEGAKNIIKKYIPN